MKITLRQGALLAAVLALLVAVPWLGSGYMTGVFTVCLIYAIWAMSWDFFSGLTGRENFGYPLFIGIGAYASAYLDANYGVSPWIGILAAIGTAALLGVAIGFPTLRLKGPYFALATLAAAAIAQRMLLILWDITGGEEGIQGLTPLVYDSVHYYYFVLATAVVSGVVLVGLSRSRWGVLLRAIRGDEASCQAAGINITFYKIAALVISAVFAGLGGALYASYQMQVSPQIVSVLMLVAVVTMVYVGGLGSVYGAAGGAILLSLLGEMLRSAGEYRLLVYALLLIGVIFFLRGGLVAPLWRRLGPTPREVAP
ncbi:branched-chain amino acid ABC transporter permease [Melaminivora alkalimesophila]|uniref:Amino acid/amide ABC transporter membrane protein 2 (HAAT family) n=1 Tax=Melaminivora alkalimesophila TaxID=1165852 RepID=A0A317RB23_9BURK|nr:branched-chain amino acid ABC transporter permease [Melaminivora alkalimesophila]PWW44356.1 amino acid/amide ABC transporter membrane protein 2 (HAAT family) [Melaminivora alkalimesophila]